MKTKLIGIRDFRNNIAKYANLARTGETRYVVTSRNNPLFEVTPYAEGADIDDVYARIAQAKKDAVNGDVYTIEQAREQLTL